MNSPEKVIKSGICLADISDHLPIFCSLANSMPTSNEPKYFRDFSNFNKEYFVEEISHIDFTGLITEDVNESMNNIVEKLRIISNKHPHCEKPRNKRKGSLINLGSQKLFLYQLKKGFSYCTTSAMTRTKLKNIRHTKISYTEL